MRGRACKSSGFRDVDSNHDSELQRLASYRLDDHGINTMALGWWYTAGPILLLASIRARWRSLPILPSGQEGMPSRSRRWDSNPRIPRYE